MRPGNFTFYVIEAKRILQSPWLKPNEKLDPVTGDWHKVGSNFWGFCHKNLVDEANDNWQETSFHGWVTLKSAIKVIKELRVLDAKGKFDCRDGYDCRQRAVRHEFRITKIVSSWQEIPVTLDDVINAS